MYEEKAVLKAEKARTGRTAGSISELPEVTAYLTWYFWQLDLGKICIRTGDLEEARHCLKTVEACMKKDTRAARYFTETFTRTELDKYRLELLTASKQFDEAEALAAEMLAYAGGTRDSTHSYTLGIRLRLGDLLAAEGKNREALAEYEEILMILREEHPFWAEQIQRVEARIARESCSSFSNSLL